MHTRGLRQARGSTRSRRGGFTVLEVLIATTLLIVGVGALSVSVASGSRLSSTKEQSGIAHNALRGILEQLQGESFEQVFARYNTDPADDPDGPGSAPGSDFAIRGLSPLTTDADGFVGRIEFPELDLGPGNRPLREDLADPALGMPRDLNGDGAVDALDHSGDYVVLPVRITLEWRGPGADRRVVLEHLLSRR